jgi:hypothetical protein
VYTSDGSGIDTPGMVAHGSAVLPGTTMAPGADGLRHGAPVEHHDVEGLSVLKSRLRGVNEGLKFGFEC